MGTVYDMELLFRKHVKNMHKNKTTTSKTSKVAKTNNNDDEGQGFPVY